MTIESKSHRNNWVVGVIFGLIGSIAINTGNNIQALGHKALKEDPSKIRDQMRRRKWRRGRSKTFPVKDVDMNIDNMASSLPHPCSSRLWILGTSIFVAGTLFTFASYAFAPQSMLASLQSIQFVTNLFFGKFILKAKITKKMFCGTLVTVLGTIIAVQFSSKETLAQISIKEMVQLYNNPAYITYIVLMSVVALVLHLTYRHYEKRKLEGSLLDRTEIIMPLCYSTSSAIIGTQSVVHAKILTELIAIQSSGTENGFQSLFTYITLAAWICTAWIWLKRLNKALSVFDPLFIIPLLQCNFIFFAIASGGIYFKEFNNFSTNQWLGFGSGVVLNFCGLKLLVPSQRKHQISPLHPQLDVAHLQEAVPPSESSIVDDASSGTLNPSISESLVDMNDSEKKPIWPPTILKHGKKLRPHRHSLTEAAAIFLTPPGVHSMPQARQMSEIKEEVPGEGKSTKNTRLEEFLDKSSDNKVDSSDGSEVPAIV